MHTITHMISYPRSMTTLFMTEQKKLVHVTKLSWRHVAN